MKTTQKMVRAALLIALAVVLPLGLHLVIGEATKVISPMHIPAYLGGLLLGPAHGALVGVFSPILSFLLTRMPPLSPPILPLMVCELAVYGLVTGLLYVRWRQNLYLALGAGMLCGRLTHACAAWLLVLLFKAPLPPFMVLISSLFSRLPLLVGHFLVVTLLVRALERAGQGQLSSKM